MDADPSDPRVSSLQELVLTYAGRHRGIDAVAKTGEEKGKQKLKSAESAQPVIQRYCPSPHHSSATAESQCHSIEKYKVRNTHPPIPRLLIAYPLSHSPCPAGPRPAPCVARRWRRWGSLGRPTSPWHVRGQVVGAVGWSMGAPPREMPTGKGALATALHVSPCCAVRSPIWPGVAPRAQADPQASTAEHNDLSSSCCLLPVPCSLARGWRVASEFLRPERSHEPCRGMAAPYVAPLGVVATPSCAPPLSH